MNDKASVTSIEGLRTFRGSLIRFVDDARASLSETEASLSRTVVWLRQDRLPSWKGRVVRDREGVAQARSRLLRRETTAMQENPQCVEERLALKAAQRRLEESEAKLASTRTWIRRLEHESEQYRGKVERLSSMLDADLPGASARLARMIDALDSYVSVAPEIITAGGAAGLSDRMGSMSRPTLAEPFQRLIDGLRGRVPEGLCENEQADDQAVWVHVEIGGVETGRYFVVMLEHEGVVTGFVGAADPNAGRPGEMRRVRLADLTAENGPLHAVGRLPADHLAIIGRGGVELVVDGRDEPVEWDGDDGYGEGP